MTHSFSSLEDYAKCPRFYYLKRILKNWPPGTIDQLLGTMYHAAFAALGLRPELNPEALAKEILSAHAPQIRALGHHPEWYETEYIAVLTSIAPLFGPGKLEPFVHEGQPMIERKFYDEALGFNGVIDFVSKNTPLLANGHVTGWQPDVACVLDFKATGSLKRRKTQADTDSSDQLNLYLHKTGFEIAGFIDIFRGDPSDIRIRLTKPPPEEVAKWKTWFEDTRACMDLIAGQTEKRFFPMCHRSNKLCCPMWCHFYRHCYDGVPLDKLNDPYYTVSGGPTT